MKCDFDIAVIGAGSGGLVTAAGSAALGAKVILFEANKTGGECLYNGCVPSKAFLKCAHTAYDIRNGSTMGIHAGNITVDFAAVMGKVEEAIELIKPHDSVARFEGLGVKVIQSKAEMVDSHTIKAGELLYTAKNIVIATGSEPVTPPIKGIEEIPYLTNKNFFDLREQPEHLIVLGAGPIGLELGQGLSHLGTKVSIIDRSDHLFKKDEPEVSPIMEARMKADGVQLHLNTKIIEVKRNLDSISVVVEENGGIQEITGSHLMVSLGRKPVTSGIGLEHAGVETDERGYIKANEKMQTNIDNIYACGDCTGPFLFTHMAGHQAGVIVRNALLKLNAKVNYSILPWTTYTRPEIAHVGYLEEDAKKANLFRDHIIIQTKEIDRFVTEQDTDGFLKLIIDKRNRIIGATLVGEKAGEIIPLASMAISKKLGPGAFMKFILSYPTESEIFQAAATQWSKNNFKDWQKKLIHYIIKL